MSEKNLKPCPSCGNFFTCTGNEDCWCEKYQVPEKGMIKIMNSFSDCICPECLAGYAER